LAALGSRERKLKLKLNLNLNLKLKLKLKLKLDCKFRLRLQPRQPPVLRARSLCIRSIVSLRPASGRCSRRAVVRQLRRLRS
jgi:hypothetical protein